MFRIARIRIRWIQTEQHESDVVLATSPAPVAEPNTPRKAWMLDPRRWRVRVRWVGFDTIRQPLEAAPAAPPILDPVVFPSPGRVSRSLDIFGVQVNVSWVKRDLISRTRTWAWGMFLLSLSIFLFTRLAALEAFPIYFFSDEAIQIVHAYDLVQRGFRDNAGQLFPVYFQNGSVWNLSLSVYIQALAVKLFGVSILISRTTSALMALSGAIAVSLILKWIFEVRWWWLGTLVLAATPAWFLHSRTAFETVMMVSFYSWFLLFYLLYRYRSPRFLYVALLFGAAAFYTYNPGQAIMIFTGVGLLLSDWRYHLKHWRTGLAGLGLLALLALPYLRFRLEQPGAPFFHLRQLNSYWLQDISLFEKIKVFLKTYGYAISPQYWFFPNEHDLVRHRIKDAGHIALWQLPFYLIGLVVSLRRFPSSAHRALLIALLSAPFGSALVELLVTRALLFVVPAAILAVLGIDALLKLTQNIRLQWALAAGATAVISVGSFMLWNNAIAHGPLWYSDYGISGMQWGAKEIFRTVPVYLEKDPEAKIYIASDWANGTSIFPRFFLPDEPDVQVRDIDEYILNPGPLDEHTLFVLSPHKYELMLKSGKFKTPEVEQVLKYPDGRDGFYFARLEYVDNIDEIFAAEKAERAKPVVIELEVDDQPIVLAHSRLDIGQATDLFDGDTFTLVRGLEANPFLLDFEFPTPRPITGLSLDFGSMDFDLRIQVYDTEGNPPTVYEHQYRNQPPDPHVELDFVNGPSLISRIYIEIEQFRPPDEPHIHIREVLFKE